MNFRKYRPFSMFIVVIFLFVLNVLFSVYLFMTWDQDIQKGKNSVEVSLPVIDWQSYSRLSKKLESGSVIPSR